MDQFYTKPEVAKRCVDFLKEKYSLGTFSDIVEPSAGNGSFLSFLPESTVAMDIDPKKWGIEKKDFYSYKGNTGSLVIGNPPFGRVSSEAIKFFNHAAKFAKVIAFIIPRTFRRVSLQNKISLDFHLVDDLEIPMGSFEPTSMKAKCCFQIWERREPKRDKISLPTKHEDFDFVDILEADFALKAYGGTGDCGRITFDSLESLNPKAWHFIRANKDGVVEKLEKLEYYPLSSNTARQDSLGKADLIYLYSKG